MFCNSGDFLLVERTKEYIYSMREKLLIAWNKKDKNIHIFALTGNTHNTIDKQLILISMKPQYKYMLALIILTRCAIKQPGHV